MSRLITLIKVVEAATDAKHRIPLEYRGKLTFFSDWDLWRYVSKMDQRTCLACLEHEHGLYQGSHIRLLFPYLEIIDEVTIAPNIHPNCRCLLLRTGEFP